MGSHLNPWQNGMLIERAPTIETASARARRIKTEPEKRNDEQKKQIRNYFFQNVYAKRGAVFQPLDKQIADIKKKPADQENAIPASLVMADLPQPRDTHILIRGQYDKKGDKVDAAITQLLGSTLPESVPEK